MIEVIGWERLEGGGVRQCQAFAKLAYRPRRSAATRKAAIEPWWAPVFALSKSVRPYRRRVPISRQAAVQRRRTSHADFHISL